MKKFSTWLLVIFMVMFWIFRICVALFSEFGEPFLGITPYNALIEKVLVFVVLLCIILVVMRKTIGAIIYLISYGIYFGADFVNCLYKIFGVETFAPTDVLSTMVALIGVVLPVLVLFDMLFDKARKANPKDNKTDWFYKNDKYERDLDDRADKNNYRTL